MTKPHTKQDPLLGPPMWKTVAFVLGWGIGVPLVWATIQFLASR